MSRRHPDNIFKYPPVQYIPLNLKNEIQENQSHPGTRGRFSIFESQEQELLNRRLNKLINNQDNYVISPDELAIIVHNGIIEYIKYRAHEIFMVGRIESSNLQLFKITTEYFYKNDLLFSFYEESSGDRIYRQSLNI